MKDGTAQPVRLSRAETKENTHRLLLEAAQSAFMRLGYQGATLDLIAASAGFTKGAVYAHFRNKEALFLELLGEGLHNNIVQLDALIALGKEQPERLNEEAERWIDAVDERDQLPLLMLELEFEARRNPSLLAMFKHIVSQHQTSLANIAARYFEIVGRVPPMPVEELAASMMVLTEGVALARQTRPSLGLRSAKAIRVLMGMPAADAK